MPSNKKWSDLSKKEKKRAKEKHGGKQGWQDAKAKSQGFKNEQDRRGNSGDRHRANNTPSPSPSRPEPAKRYEEKWSDLTPQQQARSGSKKEHNQVRAQHGLKGGKKDKTYTSPFFKPQPDSSKITEPAKRYEKKWSELTPQQQQRSGSQKEHSQVRAQYGLKGVRNNTVVTNPPSVDPGVTDNTTPIAPTYDDSELQTRFNDLSSDYDDLKSSFDDLKSNFESFMMPQAQQPQTSTETNNPFTNVASSPSPLTSGINNSSVASYLDGFKGVQITPYQPPTQASYTSESTKNPTNFTGYQPQVYVPAMHYGTGSDKSVADKQQMYVNEGGQGFYGSPQVTPTNPFTGKPFELDANGLPKLPTNFMYGPGTTLQGQLTPNKGIGV